jgi:hypothetical protein
LDVVYTIVLDSLENQLNFDFKVAPSQNYKLELLPGTITDFFENTNDTLVYNLRTKSVADYGNLTINLNGNTIVYPIIVQLTNEKGDLKREIYVTKPQSFEFNNLNPGKYMARVIFDTNENGQWDTGNFLKKIQPEKISYFPTTIELRANWEEIKTFNLID